MTGAFFFPTPAPLAPSVSAASSPPGGILRVAIEWEMDHGNLSIFVNGKEMLANNGRIGSKLYFPIHVDLKKIHTTLCDMGTMYRQLSRKTHRNPRDAYLQPQLMIDDD
jgi:hypothetical protein